MRIAPERVVTGIDRTFSLYTRRIQLEIRPKNGRPETAFICGTFEIYFFCKELARKNSYRPGSFSELVARGDTKRAGRTTGALTQCAG